LGAVSGQLLEEADTVADALALMPALKRAGSPVRVGSSALGLMVWRDIDLTVVCATLRQDVVGAIAPQLMTAPGVREVRFLNDAGALKDPSPYPDGLYLGVKYVAGDQEVWKLDIWFADDPETQPDLQHVRTIPPRLMPERRLAILRMKDVWAHREECGKTVRGYDICSALDGNVTTVAQFDAWLKGAGSAR
jgi:hypothetical protein